MTSPRTRGPAQHAEAVGRLLRSHAAIPAVAPVRLAKKTSNLFRPRSASGAPGLDVSGLDGVLEVDREGRTADVQGMCTYEDLVAATLPEGLIPLVVPQLRTITLGGAVTGLGIESTSFRNGLPHESVLEMDILTGSGEVVTATPDNEHADLFAAFPNSYGSLGYATRLKIELEAVPPLVSLRHVPFDDANLAVKAISAIVRDGEWEGERVDGLDGVAFAPGELYLTLARWTDDVVSTDRSFVAARPAGGGGDDVVSTDRSFVAARPAGGGGVVSARPPGGEAVSDYTGGQIYYRSLQERRTDLLRTEDYLWRWDTDWFWCSGAFGLHNPLIRRLWPRSKRRSDVYHRLVGLERRFGIVDRLDRWRGQPGRERVIQDIEVPIDRLAEFLAWFDDEIGMRPVWLCPLRLRGDRTWPTYPLEPGTTYVNVGFWGTVRSGADAGDAPANRAIERRVHGLGGHKSLYSEAFYDKDTFDALYDGANLAAVKRRHDPEDRLTTLYDKAVKRQ